MDLVLTFPFEALVEDLLDCLFGRLESVLLPRLAGVAPQDGDLAFLAASRGEVGHLDDHGAATYNQSKDHINRLLVTINCCDHSTIDINQQFSLFKN